MRKHLQLFPVLDEATRAALKSSIERHGVLVPVFKDQHGRILDGHHRAQIADELGVKYPVRKVEVRNDDHAAELAGTINLARRQVAPDQRRGLAAELRTEGHSLRAIGKALGVSQEQVRKDLATVNRLTVPDRITGLDGKSRPATQTKKAADVEVGDLVTDDDGQTHDVEAVEHDDDVTILHGTDDEALIVDPDREVDVARHPARYSRELLPIFIEAVPVEHYPYVLDPFAGTGRIHELPNETVGVEIEPEWAAMHPQTIEGSALDLDFGDESFDAIVTSPTYGNRFADSHNAQDGSFRRSYTHDLGRALHPDNSGAMQWGAKYRDFHEQAWSEAWRVLRPGGRFVLNIKDHVRNGRRMYVAGWHVSLLTSWGLALVWCQDVDTGSLRVGDNAEARFPEQIFVLDKPE